LLAADSAAQSALRQRFAPARHAMRWMVRQSALPASADSMAAMQAALHRDDGATAVHRQVLLDHRQRAAAARKTNARRVEVLAR
jgi:hypothetical protein